MKNQKNIFLNMLLLIAGLSLLSNKVIELIISNLEIILHHKIDFEFWSIGLGHFGVVLILASCCYCTSLLLKNQKLRWQLTAVVFIAAHFVFLFNDVVNIPITDDYKFILNFGLKYFAADTSAIKLQLISESVGEYRLIFLRLIILLQEFFTGEINLKWLILFGNLFLVIIVVLFSKSVDEKLSPAVLLISVLFLFHLGFYDAVGWATSMNYIWVAAFSMLSFYFAIQSTKLSFAFSILFSMLAIATFGNGLLVIPIILFILFITKKYKYLLVSLLLYLFIVAAYFNFFQRANVAPSIYISLPSVKFFVCSLGAAFQFFYNINVSTTAGIIMLFLFFIATVLRFYRTNLFVYSVWLWVIFSFVIVAIYRSPLGMATAISNRYGFFSSIAVICCVVFILQQPYFFKEKISPKYFISLVLIFQLGSALFFYPEMKIRKFKLQKFANDIIGEKPFVPQPPVLPENSEKIVKQAIDKKLYSLPTE